MRMRSALWIGDSSALTIHQLAPHPVIFLNGLKSMKDFTNLSFANIALKCSKCAGYETATVLDSSCREPSSLPPRFYLRGFYPIQLIYNTNLWVIELLISLDQVLTSSYSGFCLLFTMMCLAMLGRAVHTFLNATPGVFWPSLITGK